MTKIQLNERNLYDSESGTDRRFGSQSTTHGKRNPSDDESEIRQTAGGLASPEEKITFEDQKEEKYLNPIETEASYLFGTWSTWKARFEYTVNMIWLFLELHMMKVVLLTIMMLAAHDVSPVAFVLITMTCVSMPFGRRMIFTVRVCTTGVICVLVLLQMIYQIEYVDPTVADVDCEYSGFNATVIDNPKMTNTAQWLGFSKLVSNQSLFNLLRWSIIYISISTFQSVVDFRQIHQRQKIGASLKVPSVMFPEIIREDADKDTWHCLKYLMNYGFYKFGVEVSKITRKHSKISNIPRNSTQKKEA